MLNRRNAIFPYLVTSLHLKSFCQTTFLFKNCTYTRIHPKLLWLVHDGTILPLTTSSFISVQFTINWCLMPGFLKNPSPARY